jgi:YidC/Oxa1 family membrane protein insertase
VEKRTLIALVVSFAVIFSYPHLLRIFYPDYGKPPAQESGLQSFPEPVRQIDSTPVDFKIPAPTLAAPQATEDEIQKLLIGQYDLGISKKFGSIVTLAFSRFEDQFTDEPMLFLEGNDGSVGIGAVELVVGGNREPSAPYKTGVHFNEIVSTIDRDAYRLKKTLRIEGQKSGHHYRLDYENKTSQVQDVVFRIYAGSGLVQRSSIDPQYFEANWIRPSELKHVKGPGKGKTKDSEEPYRAASIKNRHFSSVLQSLQDRPYYPGVRGLEQRQFASYLTSPRIRVRPGETISEEFVFYAGLNDVEELKPYGLDPIVNFGKFDFICKLMLGLMQMVHSVVRNYGFSIILLTIGMNIVLFPLTRASFLSMRRMQLVQPQMTTLRAKYKNNPQALNKEMMALYKKHKVNPMGGCLPMVAQMPIFISLYIALSKSTDLLGSGFLWAKDLASPDNIPLPFHLPILGNSIHLLPLLMVVGMVFQQKISQANMPQADPNMARQQKMMMTLMPVFFGFIFYPMPSGLVLYWLTNTASTTFFQFMLRQAAEKKA